MIKYLTPRLHRVESMESLETTVFSRLRHRALGQIISGGDEEGWEAYITNGRFDLHLPDSAEELPEETSLIRIEFTPMFEGNGLEISSPRTLDHSRAFTVSEREFTAGVGVYIRGFLPPIQPRT